MMNMKRLWDFIRVAAITAAIVMGASAAGPANANRFEVGVAAPQGISDPRVSDRIASAKITLVRFDLRWNNIELSKGVYDWTATDKKIEQLRSNGLRAVIILDYGNHLYSDDPFFLSKVGLTHRQVFPPKTDAAQDAFVRFAGAAVLRYQAFAPIWEIWNEPDIAGFWPPTPQPDLFAHLVTTACRKMRSVDPNAYIIGPGAASLGTATSMPPLFHALQTSGATGCLSAISIHPYLRDQDVEDPAAFWRRMKSYNSTGRTANRYFVSEWGASSQAGTKTEEGQASYLAKALVTTVAAGADGFVWYQVSDYGSNRSDREQNFGLLHVDGSPKPSYFMLARLAELVVNSQYVCSRDFAGAHHYLFRRFSGKKAVVSWTIKAAKPAGVLVWPLGASARAVEVPTITESFAGFSCR